MDNDENQPIEKPEVYAVKQGNQGWQFNRRNFLVASATAITVLTTGCKVSSEILGKPTSTETATATLPPTSTNTSTPTFTATQTPTHTQTPTTQPTIDSKLMMDNCQVILAHQGNVENIKISNDGSFMVSSGADYMIKLWDLNSNQQMGSVALENPIQSIAISPDGNELAVVKAQSVIEFYSLPEFSLTQTLDLESPKDVTYSPDGKMLAVGCGFHAIEVYSLPDLELVNTLDGHTKNIYSVVFSPDGTLLYSGSEDAKIGIWSVSDGQLIKMIEVYDGGIDRITISPDGNQIASHTLNYMIHVQTLPDGEELSSFQGNVGMAFTPDSSILAYNPYNTDIYLRKILENYMEKTLTGHQERVGAIAISQDGSLLVSGSEDGAIKMWSLPDGNIIGCAIDLEAMPETAEGISYETTNEAGETVTYTLPCGSPIPVGAVCVCNCVAGSGCSCVGYSPCSCDSHSDCSCVGDSGSSTSHYWYPN